MERRAGWGEKGIQQRNESNKDGVRTGYPDHLDYEGRNRMGCDDETTHVVSRVFPPRLPRRDSNPGLPGIRSYVRSFHPS